MQVELDFTTLVRAHTALLHLAKQAQELPGCEDIAEKDRAAAETIRIAANLEAA